MCKRWRLINNEWTKVADEDIKVCHGTFGVIAKDYVNIKEYLAQIKLWAKNNCKIESIIQP